MERLLVLGGKPIGSTEIVERAKQKGIYTIVTDYLPESESPAKAIADEQWDISVDQIDELVRKAREEHVNGIVAGVHEFCLRKAIQVCEKCGLPSWCTLEQWDNCSNKKAFKALCAKNGIDVAKTYKLDDKIEFPVIVKPTDSDGSRGFSICYNREELEKGVRHALEFSTDYLIEEFIQSEACIVHYTVVNGEVIFSGISDKHSRRLEGGSMVMALQTFPAKDKERYLKDVNEKAIQMFKSIGIKNSPIWIEAFNDGKRFVFNEMALRFGGSMTNYPVMYNTGMDQLDLFIDAALGKDVDVKFERDRVNGGNYAILPIHLKEGKIVSIRGVKELLATPNIKQIVFVHHVGDEIKNWGTAQQVFCYVHVTYRDTKEFASEIKTIKDTLCVEDENQQNMLYYLMDLERFCRSDLMIDYSMPIRILTEQDLIDAKCFDMSFALSVVEEAFVKYAEGDVIFPDKVSVVFDQETQDRINCLPAAIKSEKVYGMKWVSVFPQNPHKKEKANLTAVYILSELKSGYPIAFMEGSLCSNMRTAAVGGIAAKYLARKDSEVIGFIGAGEQAKSHLMAMKVACPTLKKCYVASRTEASETLFVEQMSRFYPDIIFEKCASDYKKAAECADIIVTAISGQEKILQADWIKKGAFYCHVAGLEDDFAVPKKADKIVCDSWKVVKHRTQTISQMYQAGLLKDEDIYADLHEIVTKNKKARETADEFIYFNSVGMSFVDTLLAYRMYQKCVDVGKGQTINLKEKSMFDLS